MNISVPVVVTEQRIAGQPPSFGARPLFFSEPQSAGASLARTLSRLADALRRHLDDLGKEQRQVKLAEWTFSPTFEEHSLKLALSLRRSTLRCRVLLVVFESLGRRLAFSPALPDAWFELQRGDDLAERAHEVFAEHLDRLIREDDAYIPPAELTAAHRSWLTHLDIDVEVVPQFDATPKNPFFMLGASEPMSGRQELRKVGRCLDSLYPDELERAALREDDTAELLRLLEAPDRRPVLIVGPRRVGKTSLIHECVFRRVEKRNRPHAGRRNVFLLSGPRLVSGMMYVGQWEDRLLAILKEAKKRDHVLYFDDLLGLFNAGVCRDSDLNVAQVMRPFVERRDFRLLAELTPEALRVLREKDRGLADLFHVLPLREPSETQTRRILVNAARQFEDRYRCRFTLDVLPQVLDLTRRYVREEAQPGKSAVLLRQLAARHKGDVVSRDSVLADFQSSSGLALEFLDARTRLRRAEIVAALSRQIVGQTAAIGAMADVVCVARARLNDPGRPLASLLFLGPTGVGKTQCAKALAQYLFGDAARLIRLDMNEYLDPAAVPRLAGTFREPDGLLTSAIRRQPFSVVLLDEIEKAHRSAFDLLLQVLGEGRLTDAIGRTADFSNAIIILTSNLGSREAASSFGFRPVEAARDDTYVGAAEQFFRPEFFNRLDRVVPFQRLERGDIAGIARGLIASVLQREGLVHRRCILHVDSGAMDHLVQEGYHPQLGARALKRSIERQLAQPIAAQLAGMAWETPAVISVYPAPGGIAAHLQGMVNAPARPLVPQGLNLGDTADILDRVEDAIDRIDEALLAHESPAGLRQDQLSTAHFHYLAVREYSGHVRRFVQSIDRELGQAGRPAAPQRGAARVGAQRRPMWYVAPEDQFWRELATGADAPSSPSREDPRHHDHELRDRLVELIHESALLDAMAAGTGHDRAILIIRPIADGRTAHQDDLIKLYAGLLPREIGYTATPLPEAHREDLLGPNGDALLIEFPSVAAVLAAETGTQLFTPSHANVVPVQTMVFPLAATDDPVRRLSELAAQRRRWRDSFCGGQIPADADPFFLNPVIRVYGAFTADLRSGMVAAGVPAAEDLRRFILSQLPLPPELLE